MRALAVALSLVVTLAAPMSAMPMDDPDAWIIWTEDGPDHAVALPGDIDTIRVGVTSTDLHVDFTTFATEAPTSMGGSEIRFQIDRGQAAEVRFVWDGAPHVWFAGQEIEDGWMVSSTSGAAAWHLSISWDAIDTSPFKPFALRDVLATTSGLSVVRVETDRATGPDLEFAMDSKGKMTVSTATLARGATVEGPDFGGGTSIALDERSEPIMAYYIYDSARGTDPGIYLAHLVKGSGSASAETTGVTFSAERLDGTKISRDGGRDAQMRTQVAHDGTNIFVLFTDDPGYDHDEDGPGYPGTPDSVYVLARSNDKWVREDPTPNGKSDVGPEDVADLVARDGRLVAAVPVGNDVWVVERESPGKWKELARLRSANNAKLAIDSEGVVHAAYVVYETDSSSWRNGALYYASSRDGFKGTHMGDNISSGWEEPETDGSFAIATGPADEVALLWDDGRAPRDEEQKVAILQGGKWVRDIAPLVPIHGNPQYTMRLGYTGQGQLVAASGYGGTDTLAVRSPNGGWVTTVLDRYDVWDMAVSASGAVYFAYTQPHGGTTVAVTAFDVSTGSTEMDGESGSEADAAPAGAYVRFAPAASLGAALALLAGAAVIQLARRKA